MDNLSINACSLAETMRADTGLKKMPAFIVCDDESECNTDNLIASGYSQAITPPYDKSTLYNAIHATCMGNIDYEGVTKLSDYYKPGNTNFRPLDILIAEDNPTNQLVISKILQHAGHSPYIVENGQLALDAIEDSDFDLIIMDMQMPVMGGIEAAKIYHYTTITENRKPVIILTANATKEAKQQCEEANIDAYLTKPIEAKKLLSTIKQICNDLTPKQPDTAEFCNSSSSYNFTDKLLDTETLENLEAISGDPKFLSGLVSGFLHDAEHLLKKMESSLASSDFDSYLENAHALKGSSGSVGAVGLFDVCKKINDSPTDTANNIFNLKEAYRVYDATKAELNHYIKGKDSQRDNVNSRQATNTHEK
jgi:two-component system sensor histidine kinase RpfC